MILVEHCLTNIESETLSFERFSNLIGRGKERKVKHFHTLSIHVWYIIFTYICSICMVHVIHGCFQGSWHSFSKEPSKHNLHNCRCDRNKRLKGKLPSDAKQPKPRVRRKPKGPTDGSPAGSQWCFLGCPGLDGR